ncbi:hypothetical protein ACQ33O_07155 [Ferruginibacter sp. SUN002]|uniref:hypothetical protein n=1 Tax=Ferruginibacter sp. SUN002 TaxID=2937789 RepID=UPI003D3652FD
MKKDPKFLIAILAAIIIFLAGCSTSSKNSSDKKKNAAAIEGLWIGTYTVGQGEPVPDGTSFFFSFSIYPDGKLSYKSKGFYQNSREYITFADGTWSLNGSSFSFEVTTVNIAGGGEEHTQTGNAIYNSADGTLKSGFITDPLGGSAVWTMKKVQ